MEAVRSCEWIKMCQNFHPKQGAVWRKVQSPANLGILPSPFPDCPSQASDILSVMLSNYFLGSWNKSIPILWSSSVTSKLYKYPTSCQSLLVRMLPHIGLIPANAALHMMEEKFVGSCLRTSSLYYLPDSGRHFISPRFVALQLCHITILFDETYRRLF